MKNLSELYPLPLEPVMAERLWGRLGPSPFFDELVPGNLTLGEVWLAVDEPAESSRIVGGPCAGQTLGRLRHLWGQDLIGGPAGQSPEMPLPAELKIFRTGTDGPVLQINGDQFWHILEVGEGSFFGAGLLDGLDLKGAAREAGPLPLLWPGLLKQYGIEAGQSLFAPQGSLIQPGPHLTAAVIGPPAEPPLVLYGPTRERLSKEPQAVNEALSEAHPCWLAPKATGPEKVELLRAENLLVECLSCTYANAVVPTEGLTYLWPLYGQGRLRVAGPVTATRLQPGRVLLLPAGLGHYTVESGAGLVYLLITATV